MTDTLKRSTDWRSEALDLALVYANGPTGFGNRVNSAEDVVTTAQAFYDFLTQDVDWE